MRKYLAAQSEVVMSGQESDPIEAAADNVLLFFVSKCLLVNSDRDTYCDTNERDFLMLP